MDPHAEVVLTQIASATLISHSPERFGESYQFEAHILENQSGQNIGQNVSDAVITFTTGCYSNTEADFPNPLRSSQNGETAHKRL